MKYLAKDKQIISWLAKLAGEYAVLAPKTIAKSVTFQPYSAEELNNADIQNLLDYTSSSPKSAYIPQSEVLFTYKSTKKAEDLSKVDTVLEANIEAKAGIVFGARPCDAKGIEILDKAYLGGRYKDPYYQKHRDNTVFIAQACTMALPTCFCNWTGADLTSAHAADILFTPVEDSFVFEAFTDKGKELLKNAGFSDASDADTKKQEEVHAKAKATLPQVPNLEKLPQIVLHNFENSAYWGKVTAGCIGCSSCTFVCPTCQCFTITDEGNPLEGKRIRSWSSCMGEEFTREASGHNPRSFGFTRWRNRLSHKFSYMHAWHGTHSCTGCGRCLISCPASISIKGMIEKMLAEPINGDLPKISAAPKVEAKPKEEAKPKAEPKAKAEAKPKAKTSKKGVE